MIQRAWLATLTVVVLAVVTFWSRPLFFDDHQPAEHTPAHRDEPAGTSTPARVIDSEGDRVSQVEPNNPPFPAEPIHSPNPLPDLPEVGPVPETDLITVYAAHPPDLPVFMSDYATRDVETAIKAGDMQSGYGHFPVNDHITDAYDIPTDHELELRRHPRVIYDHVDVRAPMPTPGAGTRLIGRNSAGWMLRTMPDRAMGNQSSSPSPD